MAARNKSVCVVAWANRWGPLQHYITFVIIQDTDFSFSLGFVCLTQIMMMTADDCRCRFIVIFFDMDLS